MVQARRSSASSADREMCSAVAAVGEGRLPRHSGASQGEGGQWPSVERSERPSFPLTAGPITEPLVVREAAPLISRKSLIGLYSMYFIIGAVNGFLVQNIRAPFCLYVFDGAANTLVKYNQCNLASSFIQLPWSWKLFYALFLDKFSFFGSRRRGWIIFGWTCALAVQCVVAVFVNDFVESHNFFAYNMLLMASCFFYMFADVAGDGLCVELSKLEPDDRRGYILTTAQMTRFAGTTIVSLIATFFMNGPQMSGGRPSTFSWGFDISQIHWFIFAISIPFYITMVICLEDPPRHTHTKHTFKEAVQGIWTMLCTKAMLYMVVFNIFFVAGAGLSNPAIAPILSIIEPTPLMLSLSYVFGQLLFILGVWIFRRYFMQTNWRLTCAWTNTLVALEACFTLMIIYNFAGVGQSGWFYCFGDSVISIVQGIAQILSSLAACEIALPGLEATAYEMLSTVHNNAMTFNQNIGNTLLVAFGLNQITGDNYADHRSEFNPKLTEATITTLAISLVSILLFVWTLPANKDMCRLWSADKSWHTNRIGAIGFTVIVCLFFYATTISFLSMAKPCLKITGGEGC